MWEQCPWWKGLKKAYPNHAIDLFFNDPCTFEGEDGKKGFPPPSGDGASLWNLQHTLGVDGQTPFCARRGKGIKIKMDTQCHTPRSAPYPTSKQASVSKPQNRTKPGPNPGPNRLSDTTDPLPATRYKPASASRGTEFNELLATQHSTQRPALPSRGSPYVNGTRSNEKQRPASALRAVKAASPPVTRPYVPYDYGEIPETRVDHRRQPPNRVNLPVTLRNKKPVNQPQSSDRQPNVKKNPTLPTQAPFDWSINHGSFDWSQNCNSIPVTQRQLRDSCNTYFAKRQNLQAKPNR